jgi:hypothetical protein
MPKEVEFLVDVSTVERVRISKLKNLDPITVFMEDLEPRKGKITIECYGQSWSAYWGGMGENKIKEFFTSCSNEYLIGNLAPQCYSTVIDFDNLDIWFKKGIIYRRWHNHFSKEDARELWNDVELYCDNDEHFLHTTAGSDLAYKIFGDDFHSELPTIENQDYLYLDRIITAVKKALKGIQNA